MGIAEGVRQLVIASLPELHDISDEALREKGIDAWWTTLRVAGVWRIDPYG